MVELRYNGWGPNVLCEHCGNKLLLESATNYEECVTCGNKPDLSIKKDPFNIFYAIAIGICFIGLGLSLGIVLFTR